MDGVIPVESSRVQISERISAKGKDTSDAGEDPVDVLKLKINTSGGEELRTEVLGTLDRTTWRLLYPFTKLEAVESSMRGQIKKV